MRNLWSGAAAVLCGLSLNGCATIVSGTSQPVSFISSPEGAEVTVGGRTLGKTPMTTAMKRRPGQAISFTKEGYKPVNLKLETRLNPWFWGNFVVGGLLGSSTDGASGAINEYSPSQYLVTMTPESASGLEANSSLSPNVKTKEFIVSNYKDILADLQKGGGPYVTSVFELLSVSAAARPEETKKLKGLSEAQSSIPAFADEVIALYWRPAPESAKPQ